MSPSSLGFIIIRDGRPIQNNPTIHPTGEEAKVEATRLCKKEGCPFLVVELTVVGRCMVQEQPVIWED